MNVTLHAPVEALLKIMREHAIHHEDIEEIDAGVAEGRALPGQAEGRPPWSARRPACPFALSVAAVHGKVGVDEFTDETVSDPVIRAMIPRTKVHQDTELYERVKNSNARPGHRTPPGRPGVHRRGPLSEGQPRQPHDRG